MDKGSSLQARLIQFLTCFTFENVKQTASELLFTLCDRSVNKFVAYFGYGHVAGYLFQNGMLAGVEHDRLRAGAGSNDIDPITGEVKRQESENPFANMTDEEKEREAEKLFVLFEKLNATGVIKAAFPDSKVGE